MFFLQIAQAPITVQLGKLKLKVKKFTIDDVVSWASEIHEREIVRVTKDMDDIKKREWLQYYQPVPPDIQQMKLHLKTAEGVKRVIGRCLSTAEVLDETGNARPKLTQNQIDGLLKVNGAGRLSGLAIVLADLDEQSAFSPPEETNGADPLTSSGKAASTASPTTGPTTLPSSTIATPASPPVA